MEIRTIQPFLQYFGNVRERTLRVARCIPPDKMDWSYAPGKFTLGDLLRHLAVAERDMFAETVAGRPSRYTSHGKDRISTATLELDVDILQFEALPGDAHEASAKGSTGQARRRSPIGNRTGTECRQAFSANAQRGWNAHPAGLAAGVGGLPCSGTSGLP